MLIVEVAFGQLIPPDFAGEPASSHHTYWKNEGQLLNTDLEVADNVLFYTINADPGIYVTQEGVSTVYHQPGSEPGSLEEMTRLDLVLENAHLGDPFPLESEDSHLNFYLPHIPDGVVDVGGYHRLVYQNVYPFIDYHLYSNAMGFKSYFVVRSGGDPVDIVMSYEGIERLDVAPSGELLVYAEDEVFTHPMLKAYELVNGLVQPVNWTASYQVTGNRIHIQTGPVNTSNPLVIQMDNGSLAMQTVSNNANLNWSTGYGGSGLDAFLGARTNASNGLWVKGTTSGVSSSFPVTTGAFQITYAGVQDAVVAHFNDLGQRQWATYLGGSDRDGGLGRNHGIAVDNSDNCYVVFRTSSDDIPLVDLGGGAYFDQVNDCNGLTCADAYIARFDNTGQLDWGTYFGDYGGTGRANDVEIDSQGNVYVIGQEVLNSTSGPIGSYVSSQGAAFIAQFNSNGVLQWATNFGGVNTGTSLSDLVIDGNDNLIIVGSERSGSNYVLQDPGSGAFYQSTFGGGSFDGLIVKFDSQKALVWSTFYGGAGNESVRAATVSPSGEIFVAGWTDSQTGFSILNSGGNSLYQSSFMGKNGAVFGADFGDAFFAKFSSTGVMQHATYYGENSNEGTASLAYDNGYLYAVQNSTSDGLTFASPNATNAFTQTSHADGHDVTGDAMLTVFTDQMELVWTTYFGGTRSGSNGGLDMAHDITISNNNKLYMVGESSSNSQFPLEDPGNSAYYQNSTLANGFIAQFELQGIISLEEQTQINNLGSIDLWPNPSANYCYLNSEDIIIKSVSVYDVKGNEVHHEDFKGLRETSKKFSVAHLSPGLYLVNVQGSKNGINGLFSGKLLVE